MPLIRGTKICSDTGLREGAFSDSSNAAISSHSEITLYALGTIPYPLVLFHAAPWRHSQGAALFDKAFRPLPSFALFPLLAIAQGKLSRKGLAGQI